MPSELIAVLIAVSEDRPMVLTLDSGRLLPSGPLEAGHRSLQTGLRLWVERQTGHALGHVEQLYTFADAPDGTSAGDAPDDRTVLISYLALTRIHRGEHGWRNWYAYFPWEDQTAPSGRDLVVRIAERLNDWARQAPPLQREVRRQRIALTFGLDGLGWDDELVLQRYELLWEAGLVPESGRAGAGAAMLPGVPMARGNRRILATAMARLRAKIRYRPVIFELMPDSFTLLHLQRTVEAVAGQSMHKQNFRRLITQQDLVEETADFAPETRGRPARLFRFRREVIGARRIAGSKLPLTRPF
ncbi:conserved hypothetical protein [Gluconacetobacter diazotrophicus PA1 5]|uniref:NrtR DNA-binding winged helix domain-containing protein n=2 Tax=Gluconacetobacter diazotrophicus TaxID=33996 RepID=A9H8B7_GLUDA|nr:membrane protein [Gluconacetobacter diazotrophicus]ACI51210.1 conserved hypothetical protein [Gluconacetobacter diazotrophicus PA1 5]MBB2155077.1 hypothetical protein [Gluconacetobacter diazotrophicus]TWB09766.1 hypothetical protein FBZ86_10346 [Gluconacetobacter diazotrophicus]CAP54512.1 conserved hypothetical protein [Gluconacetobacter diazotrophicus PA1 5]